MIKAIIKLIEKYKELILYCISGAIVTAVNWAVYYLFYEILKAGNVPAQIISWIVAVAVAYVTNKLMVFRSFSWKAETVFPELTKFVTMRIASGVLELVLMWITVDLMKFNGMLMKVIISIAVIIMNYAASKLYIFNESEGDKK